MSPIKTIAIDASRANKDHKTGTEWYSYHVIEELKKIIPESVQVVLYTPRPLQGALGRLPANWQEKVLSWPPRYLWTQLRLWWEIFFRLPEVFFVPAHTIPFLPIRKKTRVLVNVHDVGFKRQPELYKPVQIFYHGLTMKKILHRADVIITISQFSRREIEELYRVPAKKIAVVHLGYDSSFYRALTEQEKSVSNEILSKYRLKQPYILYVGRLEKKKNIGGMVKAFVLIKAKQENLRLVLAGNAGNEYQPVKDIIANLRLAEEIILPGYIAQEDLPAVIGAAEAFLFPTWYEGFGLPILEAMACGVPVITSDLEPHREVAGGAAVLVNPAKPEELAQAMSRLLTDSVWRQSWIDKGWARAGAFSWAKTAEKIWRLMQ